MKHATCIIAKEGPKHVCSKQQTGRPERRPDGRLIRLGLFCIVLAGLASVGCQKGPGPADPFARDFAPYAPELGLMAVQDEGRFKTFDTLASSILTDLTGSSSLRPTFLKNKDLAGLSPVFTCLDLMLRGKKLYYNERIVFIKNPQVRKRLVEQLGPRITPEEAEAVQSGYVSMAFLDQPQVMDALVTLASDVMFMQRPLVKLQNAIIAAQTLYRRTVLPPATGDVKTPWLPFSDLFDSAQRAARESARSQPAEAESPEENADTRSAANPQPVANSRPAPPDPLADYPPALRLELQQNCLTLLQNWGVNGAEAGAAGRDLVRTLEKIRPDIYPPRWQRQVEAFYMNAGKLTWAWTIYAVAAFFLLLAAVRGWPRAGQVGAGLFVIAFGLHTAAIALRWIIAGRIPIATQYESMLAAGWFAGYVALAAYWWSRWWGRPAVKTGDGDDAGGEQEIPLTGPGRSAPSSRHGTREGGQLTRWLVLGVLLTLAIAAGMTAGSMRDLLWMAGRPGVEHVTLGVFAGLIVFLILLGKVAYLAGRPFGKRKTRGVAPRPIGDSGVGRTASTRSLLFLLGAAVACMTALWFGHYRPVESGADIRTIEPILNDTLLYIHVNVIMLSYALIAMAAVISGLYLVMAGRYRLGGLFSTSPDREGGVRDDIAKLVCTPPLRSGLVGKMPAYWREVLDGSTMSLLQACFIVLWAGIILGAVWADYSWGRCWGWDPKEVFALNTWVVLLILVHVRLKLDRERKAFWTAVLCVTTCAVMVFNYYWVNFVIPGLHSYA